MAGLLLSTPPGDVEQARADFERGAALYRAGDFRAALAAFEAAQARAPAPQALFNIARCQERLGQLADAVDSYDRLPRRGAGRAGPGPRSPRASSRAARRASRSRHRCASRWSLRPRWRWTESRPARPPSRSVSARAPPASGPTQDGYQPLEREVELAPGAPRAARAVAGPGSSRWQRAPSGHPRRPSATRSPRFRGRSPGGGPTSPPASPSPASPRVSLLALSAHQAQDTLKDGTPRSPEQVQQIYDTAERAQHRGQRLLRCGGSRRRRGDRPLLPRAAPRGARGGPLACGPRRPLPRERSRCCSSPAASSTSPAPPATPTRTARSASTARCPPAPGRGAVSPGSASTPRLRSPPIHRSSPPGGPPRRSPPSRARGDPPCPTAGW